MTIFEDLEEKILNTFNTSEKQSIKDIGIDDEEQQKIINIVSASLSSELNVDFSDFSNHIFFGSAYAAVNFALERIIKEYPFDGELKQKNEWKNINSPYENWFFENYPKQQGYLYLSNSFPFVRDYQGLLSVNSGTTIGSFCVESVVRPRASISTSEIRPIYSYVNPNNRGHFAYFNADSSGKYLNFSLRDDSGTTFSISCSYDSYISSSHMVSFVWDSLNKSGSIHIDGERIISKEQTVLLSTASVSGAILNVGFYSGSNYSGSLDDFRYWKNFETPRSEEQIRRNYYRSIHSNISGGLSLYWKFNQVSDYGSNIIDQSGNELHGAFSGNFSFDTNIPSGTLGDWFKDDGDPIISLGNSRVVQFVSDQRNSGSIYDDSNQNLIYNLVPNFFTDGNEDTEYQKLFLLLTARHFDRLKIYIDNLSNILKMQTEKYGGPPVDLLDIAAKHFGINLGDVYSGAEPLQYYFGENVYSSGSMQDSLFDVRETIKRNIFSNLIYLIKTKSTQESIKSILRAVGLNDNIVTINEYTDFSGGISTTFSPRIIEQRVLNFQTSSNVNIDPSKFNLNSASLFQVRALFSTASLHLTQSIFSLNESQNVFYVNVIRENLTSSNAKFVLTALSSNLQPVSLSSSYFPFFDNEWINFSFCKASNVGFGFFTSLVDRSGLVFSSSNFSLTSIVTGSTPSSIYLGSSGTNKFDGFMHEFRGWSYSPIGTIGDHINPVSNPRMYERYAYDWSLTETRNFDEIDNLKVYLKMNDYTGSAAGSGELHNYVDGITGSTYSGLSSSYDFNFPGKYIVKWEVPTSYDLNVDNDKIRIKNQTTFTQNDRSYDVPFVSIDFSPITPLNKEIIRWVGDISKFSNITADPIYDYMDENPNIINLRRIIFEKRFNSKINFSAFANLIQWFDNNFTFLISQFIPLDMAYSLSNFIVEPHLLEYNKVKKVPNLGGAKQMTTLEATITTRAEFTASSSESLALADPGRFGAFASSSADLESGYNFVYVSSSNGINHQRYYESSLVLENLRSNVENWAPPNYGNAFYIKEISGSNYEKNVLNLIPEFNLTGIMGPGSSGNTPYLSSSHGDPGTYFTSSFLGSQDARWLWMRTFTTGAFADQLFGWVGPLPAGIPNRNRRYMQHNYGIGYGGMWGQLRRIHSKATNGVPLFVTNSYDPTTPITPGGTNFFTRWPGNYNQISRLNFSNYIEFFNDLNSPTKILWPTKNSHNGVFVAFSGGAAKFIDTRMDAAGVGELIDIEGYRSLNFEIIGSVPSEFAQSFSASFQVKFQFFSKETPGTHAYETVLSSSKATGYEISNIPVVYNLSTPNFPKPNPAIFSVGFQRKLPKQKFMRVFISPVASQASIETVILMCVRGVLSKEEVEDESIPERKV